MNRWRARFWCVAILATVVSAPAGAQPDPMVEWIGCLHEAADALHAQPEPANVIALAVFSVCLSKEMAWIGHERATRGTAYAVMADVKADTMMGIVLERVMVARAARAKTQDLAPSYRAVPFYKPT